MSPDAHAAVQVAVALPSEVGESPFWHPQERALYWIDIDGRSLHRFEPHSGALGHWALHAEPGACAPLLGGGLLVALRDGLWRLDLAGDRRERLVAPPYDPSTTRFNDGKCDPQGRFWVGTIYEPRDAPKGALYCWDGDQLRWRAGGVVTANGLAWSPDGHTLYWADTRGHRVDAFDLDVNAGTLSGQREFVRFAPRAPSSAQSDYGGRPDGAAVDVEGAYWVAMYEGGRLLRFSPTGELLREVTLPVQCPTAPCFGGDDLRTLYVTTARAGRPAQELASQPFAGCVLQLRVDVPGLPVNFAT